MNLIELIKTHVMPAIVAIVATWVVGFLWFKVLFRLPSADGLSSSTVSLIQHVGDIGFACLLAWIMFRTGMRTVTDGILLALMVWLGFVLAVAGHMFAFRSFTPRSILGTVFVSSTTRTLCSCTFPTRTVRGPVVGNRAQQTEHAGAKKGRGAYYGRKRDAKWDSAKLRRRNDADVLLEARSHEVTR